MKYNYIDWIAFTLTIIGGINWGLVGVFQLDLVSWLFDGMLSLPLLSQITYTLVGLSALYLGLKVIISKP
jgi:hypothetical protein